MFSRKKKRGARNHIKNPFNIIHWINRSDNIVLGEEVEIYKEEDEVEFNSFNKNNRVNIVI